MEGLKKTIKYFSQDS